MSSTGEFPWTEAELANRLTAAVKAYWTGRSGQSQSQGKRGVRDAVHIRFLIEQNIRTQSTGEIDYVACVNDETLHPFSELKGTVLIAVAARWGQTRLIDNLMINVAKK